MSHIIQVYTLADFEREVPPSVVRLSLTMHHDSQKYGDGNACVSIPFVQLNLNLQGLNDQGQIVWLHDSYKVRRSPGGGDFWSPRDASRHQQMPAMEAAVCAHLIKLGYEIRAGQFGISRDIQPVCGSFECVQWVENATKDGYILITDPANTGPANAGPTNTGQVDAGQGPGPLNQEAA